MPFSIEQVRAMLISVNLPVDQTGLNALVEGLINFQSDQAVLGRYEHLLKVPKYESLDVFESKAHAKQFNATLQSSNLLPYGDKAIRYDDKSISDLLAYNIITSEDVIGENEIRFDPMPKMLHLVTSKFGATNHSNSIYVDENRALEFVEYFKDFSLLNWAKIQEDPNFPLSYDVLMAGKDLWDWDKISASGKIRFDEFTIDLLSEFLNFSILCKNPHAQWNNSLIEKYQDKINFKSLSSSPYLPFHHDWRYFYESKLDLPSLVKNPRVYWDLELFERYIKPTFSDNYLVKKDDIFFQLISYGRLSTSVISECEKLLDQKITIDRYVRRNSDGYRDYSTEHKLWEFFTTNPNIFWDDELFLRYYKKIEIRAIRGKIRLSVRSLSELKDYIVPYNTGDIEDYDGNVDVYPAQPLFEVIKNKCSIYGLNYDNFLKNEISWWGTFNSNEFLNPSINAILKRYFGIRDEHLLTVAR
ncbi:hypothetical protein J2Y45_006075 [Dyadobacter sp. BE34]|uniref:Uncharacterized protein n=1 Tax=Dyadobacter fermentans TaxID=94254 RepID=A0ABU1R6N2_9BACT|nr:MULTISPECIES: hypothetical protein [Dyadobacter]MDR6808862.1 hypothetical protein [Dyadobacter fermentans]MDR7046605.1 hypothetical protein [Dyadobacter sp. BE242]MDR7200918.1 hypothetical protein [Dyadobacter sp. BE34]MDR7218879.1 hypothetical protein [Dyadobacter sp. BE31]MDR7264911.1 hypothetical protein [Dyadobacter sp. BE32]